jgi:hypothetical protein
MKLSTRLTIAMVALVLLTASAIGDAQLSQRHCGGASTRVGSHRDACTADRGRPYRKSDLAEMIRRALDAALPEQASELRAG